MNSLFGRVAAGTVARVSFLVDLLLMVSALIVSTFLSGAASLPPELLSFSLVALLTWLITAMALRQYDPWASDRAYFDDSAMTSILVLAVTTVLACATLLFKIPGLPNVGIFLLLFWPATVA